MRNYITEISKELEFPVEAEQTMLAAWDSITGNEKANIIWKEWLDNYEKDIHLDYTAALKAVDSAAEAAGVHKYTAELLYFLCLTKHLKALYTERNIDLKIWHDSCMDLHWKLFECKKMYDIWGSFVAWWFPGFFDMTRFALGRLQFELIDAPENWKEYVREKGEGITKLINVHIPSAGKLHTEECDASFRQAAGFFADAFPGEEVVVFCESWMLYAPQKAFLKPDSGVVTFMNRFEIYHIEEGEDDLWRIFNLDYEGKPEALPENTSMQRAYKQWLTEGNRAGYGEGFFFMKKG